MKKILFLFTTLLIGIFGETSLQAATLSNAIKDLSIGENLVATAVVTAQSSRALILTDNAGSILYYNTSVDLDQFPIGTIVNVEGTVSTYNRGFQLTNLASIEVVGSENYNYPTPIPYTVDMVEEACLSTDNIQATYVSLQGFYYKSGNFFNFKIPGSTYIGSIYYPTSEVTGNLIDGEEYIFTGYFTSVSNSQYFYIVCTSVEKVDNYLRFDCNAEDDTCAVSGYVDPLPSDVVIPATYTINGKTYTVTSIGAAVFYKKWGDEDTMLSVSIPNTVTEIGVNAFRNRSKLTILEIPNSVTTIGSSAFEGCSGLKSVEIPNSVTTIEHTTFQGCSGLTTIEIPNSVTSIDAGAFFGCSGLTSVEIPNSVTSIGDSAFKGCSSLTAITFGESLEQLGSDALSQCPLENATVNCVTIPANFLSGISSLKELTLGNTVTSIGKSAFQGCRGLKSVKIPNSVTTIGSYAFQRCEVLTSVEIPNSITTIEQSTFQACSGLTSVKIPNSVTTIEQSAFQGCSGLTSVEIPNSITSIGQSAFQGCSGLTSIEIPNSVTIIEQSTFQGCSGMTSVEIPNSVTIIDSYAFHGCKGLTSIDIPNSVTSIGRDAFLECNGLTNLSVNWITPIPLNSGWFSSVTYSEAVLNVPAESWIDYLASSWKAFINMYVDGLPIQEMDDGTFYYVYIPDSEKATLMPNSKYVSFTTATIPDRVVVDGKFYYVVEIGPEAFKGCFQLKTIVFPSKCEKIGQSAFQECSRLTNVEIPNSVTAIGSYAFLKCNDLTSIEIPNLVTSIGQSAFQGCRGLTSVKIPNSVTTIEESTFQDCNGLTSIEIPNSVTSIGPSAFQGCTGLTGIQIPNSVRLIGFHAFYECNNLKEMTFGNSVEEIGRYAFENCNKLQKVDISDITSWCNIKFIDSSSNPLSAANHLYLNGEEIVDLVIPFGVESIKPYAFYDGSSIKSITIPQSVGAIEENAFYKTGIEDLRIPSSVLTYSGTATTGCTKLKTFTFDQSTTPIDITDRNLFPVNITTLNIGRDLNFIEERYSIGIKSIEKVNFGDGVSSINDNLFSGNSNLKEIVIPSSVEYIGESAFQNTGLETIVMGAGVSEIGDKAFSGINPENIYVTAPESPVAQNTVFSNIAGTLYVMPGSEEEYYNNPNCWYQFKYPTPLVVADGIEVKEEVIDGILKLTATILPENVTLPYVFWTSSNPEVACVNPDGTIYVYDEKGTCEFTATTLYPEGPTATVSFDGNIVGGVETIGKDNRPQSSHIFTLQGVCVKRNATPQDVKALEPGIYIINGKKVMISK